mmetsp:Transcript_38698/g.58874  ORF Transcript_38698/g.58874 Transcript_38698/m.58874 type:complete len:140 (+) Transcript_38698:31-450(+)
MQGFFALVNCSAVIYVNLVSSSDKDETVPSVLDIAGLCIWACGFLMETIADLQLARFLKNPPPGSGKFCKVGLWRYSRHPNYFGEAFMWWGIWLIACNEDWGWVTVYSCVFITLLIRFLSGVPFPEKKYADNTEWQEYC